MPKENYTAEQLHHQATHNALPKSPVRFFRMQNVKFPLGDGTYQMCLFIGVDCHGVATVKTQGGRYKAMWECNLYPA